MLSWELTLIVSIQLSNVVHADVREETLVVFSIFQKLAMISMFTIVYKLMFFHFSKADMNVGMEITKWLMVSPSGHSKNSCPSKSFAHSI